MASKSPNWLRPEQREALSRIPDDLTEREIVRYYTLSEPDRHIITHQTRSSTRLGFAVQLAVLRYPGFPLYRLPEVPPAIIEYLAQQLQVNSSDYAAYRRGNTQSDHLEKIRQFYGFRNYDGWVMLALTRQLVGYALENRHKLAWLEITFELMREQHIIVPAITTLERLIWNVERIAEYLLYERLTRPLPPTQRVSLQQLLFVSPTASSQTGLTWLKKPVGKLSSRSFQHLLERIEFLERLALPSIPQQVHPQRVRQLARRAEQYTPTALRMLKNEREQLALLVAYLHDLHSNYIDQMLDMFDRWLSDLFKRGQMQQQKHIQRHSRSLHRDVHRLARAIRAFLKAHDEDLDPFAMVFATAHKSQLVESVTAIEQTARPANLDFRDLLEATYRKRRRTLLAWYSTLHFRSVKTPEPALEALDFVMALDQTQGKRVTTFSHRLNDAWISPPLDHLQRKRWEKHTLQNERINPNFYEMAALDQLRTRLRSGDIFVMHSRRYQAFDSYLLSPSEWQRLQNTDQSRLALSGDVQAYLHNRQAEIERMLDVLTQQLPQHPHLHLDDQGQVHLTPLEQMEAIDAGPWQRRLDRMMPTMQLADLLLEVDQWTHFLSHFTHLNFGVPSTKPCWWQP